MKKTLLQLTTLLFATFFIVSGLSAQKWLEKTLNKVDKTLDQVDKALNTDEEQTNGEQVTFPIQTDSTALEGTIFYKMENPGYVNLKAGQIYFTDHFVTNVTYVNEKGILVTEKNIKLPWSKNITIRAPFKAIFRYEHKLKVPTTSSNANNYVCYYTTPTNGSIATFQVGSEGYVKTIVRNNHGYAARGTMRNNIDSWLLEYGNRRYEWDFTEENFANETSWKPKK